MHYLKHRAAASRVYNGCEERGARGQESHSWLLFGKSTANVTQKREFSTTQAQYNYLDDLSAGYHDKQACGDACRGIFGNNIAIEEEEKEKISFDIKKQIYLDTFLLKKLTPTELENLGTTTTLESE